MRRPSLVLVAVCLGWGSIPLVVRHVDLPAVAVVFDQGGARRRWASGRAGPPSAACPGPRLLSFRPAALSRDRRAARGPLAGVHRRLSAGARRHRHPHRVPRARSASPSSPPGSSARRSGPAPCWPLRLGAGRVRARRGPAPVERAGGTGLALAGFASASFVVLVLISKPLAQHYGGLRLAFMELTGASVVLAPVGRHSRRGGRRDWSWGWLAVLGLGHTALGLGVYLWAWLGCRRRTPPYWATSSRSAPSCAAGSSCPRRPAC